MGACWWCEGNDLQLALAPPPYNTRCCLPAETGTPSLASRDPAAALKLGPTTMQTPFPPASH
jgi:hypothetical protein